MPKSQSTPPSTEADFSCSKYTKRGKVSLSQRGAQDGSGTHIVDKEGSASF